MQDKWDSTKIPSLWCSTRLSLAILSMLGCVCFYSLRVNVSFSVVCMVNHTAIHFSDDATSIDQDVSNSTNIALTRYNSSAGGVQSVNASLQQSYSTQANDSGAAAGGNSIGQCGSRGVAPSAVVYEDGELVWDKEQQGLVLGSIFWGYMLTNVAGGIAATLYGGKRVIGGTLACASVLTAVTPVAARYSVYAMISVRILVGMCLGCISPSLHALWAQWAPPQESSKLRSFCFAGCQMGYVFTFPVTALLCEYGFDGGWPTVFYLMGGAVLVWCLSWMLLVTDSPMDHPRISAKEREYIVTSLKGTISLDKKRQHNTPWRKVLGSRPVWAAFIAHTCFNWGEYTFLTNIPTYLREVLLFDIKANGFLSALPYGCFWFVINLSGFVADIIRNKGLMNTTMTRKVFNFFGSVVPAALLVGVGFLDCSHSALAVGLLTMGVAMTGCLYGAGLYINFSDLSPRHAGFIYGISNTIATVPGFVAPIVIGVITRNQTQEEWRWVFFLASFIFVLGCVIFFVFGSGDIQPWAAEAEALEFEVDDPSPSTPSLIELDSEKVVNSDVVTSNGAASSNGSVLKMEEKLLHAGMEE